MSTALSKPYAHCWDEMHKGIDMEGPYYNVKYYFSNWADSDNIANEMKGITTRVGGATVRGVPHQHPLSPNLYCKEARVEGVGNMVANSNGLPSYDAGFFVYATYRSTIWTGVINPFDDPDGQQQIDPTDPQLWCTQELNFETEDYIINNHSYIWSSDGTISGVPIKIKVGITNMSLTFHRVPFIPTPQMRTYRGTINNTTFLGAGPGKVLFAGGTTVREASTDGNVTQRVTLVFKEREKDWNTFYRRDVLDWDFITDSGGKLPYKGTELNDLLKAFAG